MKYSSTHTETQWSKRCTEPNPAWIYIEVQENWAIVESLSGKEKKKK